MNSLQYAPGDVINLKAGSTWTGTTLNINRSGVSGNPIRFQSYGTGNKPAFSKPQDDGSGRTAIVVNGNWIVMDGIMVRDTGSTGFFVPGSNNIITNSEVARSGVGADIKGRNNLVTKSYFHDLVMVKNTPKEVNAHDDYGAVAIIVSNDDNEISYNRMENCKASSYDYGTDGGTIEIWRNANNMKVHHNWAMNNDGFLEAGSDNSATTNNATIAYNVMINNGILVGIHFGGIYKTTVNNMKFQNNSIVQTTSSKTHFSAWQASGSSSSVNIQNNIFYTMSTFMDSGANFSHSYNLFHFLSGGSLGATSFSTGELTGNPLFVNVTANDLHLTSGSPARGKGTNLGGTLDYDNKPVSNPPDLGAYQFGSTAPTPTRTSTPIPSSTPVKTATPMASSTPRSTATKTPIPSVTESPSCKSDINQDAVVDLQDYSILVTNFLKPEISNPRSDINKDSVVDLFDYSILIQSFLRTCP